MLGATGAVGSQVELTLANSPMLKQLTLLGRSPAENIVGPLLIGSSKNFGASPLIH